MLPGGSGSCPVPAALASHTFTRSPLMLLIQGIKTAAYNISGGLPVFLTVSFVAAVGLVSYARESLVTAGLFVFPVALLVSIGLFSGFV